MDEPGPVVAHQFDDAGQQRDSAVLGMWVFLVTEIMFFGGLFAGYTAYRYRYAEGFAEASHHLNMVLGAWNTAILLTSSLMMTLAIRSAQLGRRRQIIGFLVGTLVLGTLFLGIKGWEYHEKFVAHLVPGASFAWDGAHAQQARMFFYLYFAMTGLHGLHLIGGLVAVLVAVVAAGRGRFTPFKHTSLELTGLYWHFVDILWIFLFPLLYLIGHRL